MVYDRCRLIRYPHCFRDYIEKEFGVKEIDKILYIIALKRSQLKSPVVTHKFFLDQHLQLFHEDCNIAFGLTVNFPYYYVTSFINDLNE